MNSDLHHQFPPNHKDPRNSPFLTFTTPKMFPLNAAMALGASFPDGASQEAFLLDGGVLHKNLPRLILRLRSDDGIF